MKPASCPNPGSIVLCLLLACALCPPVSAAVENLALNRPYVCSDLILPGWTGLTDGVVDADSPPGCFATGDGAQFPKQIVVDLGAVCTISKISLINSANGNTKRVAISVSRDARDFEQLREYYFPAEVVQTLAHSFAPRQARYVRVVLYDTWGNGAQGPNCLFLRELQVFGELPAGGRTTSGREELRLARLQPPLVVTPALTLFRRYRLPLGQKLRVGVLGDSFAAATEQDGEPWPAVLTAQMEAALGPGQVEMLNLAAVNQGPAEGLAQLLPLGGKEPADVIFLAYGKDAATAKADLIAFRNAWQGLVDKLTQGIPALVVTVTPPPLLDDSGKGPSVLPYAQALEQLAAHHALPVVRSASVLAAAADPLGCYAGPARLNDNGKLLIAKAIKRLLWGSE